MGNSQTKQYEHVHSIARRLHEQPFRGPTERDVNFLVQQTLMARDDVVALLTEFLRTHPDGRMSRADYCDLYVALRKESPEMVAGLSDNIFRALDVGVSHENFITFNEFLITYALTSRGDLRRKLEYAFDIYASNGPLEYMEVDEVHEVVYGILELLSSANERERTHLATICKECCQDVKVTQIVLKEDFISGLLANKHLRMLMQPFDKAQ